MKALAVVLFAPLLLAAAQEGNGRGTKAIALAGAFTAASNNSWAVSYNAAGLAQLRFAQASIFFIPQQFGLPELRTIAASGAFPINPGSLGIAVERFGFDLFHTTTVSVGYGILLTPIVAVGLTSNLEQVSIERYGSDHVTTFDVGLLGWPTPELSLGFAFRNVTAAAIGAQHERLPQTALLGASFSPLKNFTLLCEFEKEARFPPSIKGALEQTVWGVLSLRCGVANNPDKFSAGFAVRYGGVEFGYAGYSHAELGWTHQVDVTLSWGDAR